MPSPTACGARTASQPAQNLEPSWRPGGTLPSFGLKQAAALWTCGVGRNGKDTLCNLMGSILGSYAVSIDSTFSKIRDPNAPSPVYALTREPIWAETPKLSAVGEKKMNRGPRRKANAIKSVSGRPNRPKSVLPEERQQALRRLLILEAVPEHLASRFGIPVAETRGAHGWCPLGVSLL